MKLYQVQFENYLEKTYYIVERDEEKALIRAFNRLLNDGVSHLAISAIGEGAVLELCDAKDIILDILDALDEKKPDMVVGVDRASGESFSVVQEYQNKPENPDKALDAGGR